MPSYDDKIFDLVSKFFKDDVKVITWYYTVNPLLGQLRPIDFLTSGREEKLYRLVLGCLEGNYA